MYNGTEYLFRDSSKNVEAYRVAGQRGDLKIDKYFSGKNARSDAVQAAKLFKEQVDNLTKGFITRAELATRLGVQATAIERAKYDNSRLWQQIKNLMEIKQTGVTSPEYYKFNKNPEETIKTLKKFSGGGGKGLPRFTYRGKKTVIGKVRDILIESKIPLNIKDIVEKLTGKRPRGQSGFNAAIRNAVSVLNKQEEFKNKIVSVSQEETIKGTVQTKALKRAPYIKLVRDVFVQDPDAGIGDVAEGLFGTKHYRNASDLAKLNMEKEASVNVIKFLQAISGEGSSTIIKGFKDIPPDKLGNILESIESRVSEFGFEPTSRRRLQFAIADATRSLPPGYSEGLIKKLRQAGFAVDEVIPVASVFKDAPGYMEATQKIPNYINSIKGTTLDARFGTTFKKVLKGDFSGVETFNKASRDFAKEWKIDTPIIRTGKGLNPADFVESFDKYTKAGQKNILQLAKEKSFVIETKSKPLEYIIKLISGLKPGSTAYNRVCGIGTHVVSGIKAAGGRVGYKAAGSVGSCPILPALEAAPEQTMNELSKLGKQTGVLGRIGNTATTFLGTLGKFGTKAAPLAALAAAGAAIEPLVKQFVSDDPNTYLTNENQMKGMLVSLLENETPKVDEEILKWQYPALGAATAAGAIPGARELYKTRRGVGPVGPLPGVGKTRAALGISGVLGKALGATFSPLAAAATLPISIAAQRAGGTDYGDIATDPMNWMGPAFASTGAEMATRGMKDSSRIANAIRLGFSPRTLSMFTRRFGLPGLAISAGLWGYDKWKNRSINDE